MYMWALQTILKREHDRRLIQFFMGLNESFKTVRENLLMISPLPTIGHAYSLLIQKEKQRDIHAPVQFMTDAVSLYGGNQRNFQSRENFQMRENFSRNKFDNKKPGVICHPEEKC